MNVLFNINYQLAYGEDMLLNIIAPNGQIRSQRMSSKGDGIMSTLAKIDSGGINHIDYYYSVERSGQPTRSEWTTQTHRIDLTLTGVQQYTTNDVWREIPQDSYLYSSAFTAEALDPDSQGVPQRFVLHGKGWGHGVGLCQIGAAVMGSKGFSYTEILQHYYNEAKITKRY